MSDSPWIQFSIVGFVVAIVAVSGGAAAGLALVPIAGSFVGLFVGGFVAGLAVEDRPLLEAGVAAALVTLGILAVGAGIGNGIVAAVTALGAINPVTLLVSVTLGSAVGAFGAHFGDDLRDGLTEPIEDAGARVPGPDTHSSPVAESSASHAADDADDHEPVTDEIHERGTEPSDSREDVELDRD